MVEPKCPYETAMEPKTYKGIEECPKGYWPDATHYVPHFLAILQCQTHSRRETLFQFVIRDPNRKAISREKV